MPVGNMLSRSSDEVHEVTDPHDVGLMTAAEAAELAGVSQSHIYRVIGQGQLHYAARDRAGGLLLKRDVEEWIQRRQQAGNSRARRRDLPTLGEYARRAGPDGARTGEPSGGDSAQS